MKRMIKRARVLLMIIPMIAVIVVLLFPVAGQAFILIGPENALPDDPHSAMTLEYNEALYQGRLFVYSKTTYERQLARARGEGAGRRSDKVFWLY